MAAQRVLISLVLMLSGLAWAQAPSVGPVPRPEQASTVSPQTIQQRSEFEQLRPNYVLHAGDQIMVRAAGIRDIEERPYMIDGDGFVDLPTLGRVKAGGLTVAEFEASLVKLTREYVLEPRVTVTVVQYSNEPIFIVGAFKAPGIYPLGGRRTLTEMMAAVGGLLPNASRRIKITRRKEFGQIPLPSAVSAPDGSSSSVEINMARLRDNLNPAEDIQLQPFDVISVERAEMVYVLGAVARSGALELQEKDYLSVTQALTEAGGLVPGAKTKQAYILRPVLNTSRRVGIPLNLKRVLSAEDRDLPLLPNDVLYVPAGTQIRPMDLAYMLTTVSSLALSIASFTR